MQFYITERLAQVICYLLVMVHFNAMVDCENNSTADSKVSLEDYFCAMWRIEFVIVKAHHE